MLIGDLCILIARSVDGKLIATCYRLKIKEEKKPSAAYFKIPSAVKVAVPWDATALWSGHTPEVDVNNDRADCTLGD